MDDSNPLHEPEGTDLPVPVGEEMVARQIRVYANRANGMVVAGWQDADGYFFGYASDGSRAELMFPAQSAYWQPCPITDPVTSDEECDVDCAPDCPGRKREPVPVSEEVEMQEALAAGEPGYAHLEDPHRISYTQPDDMTDWRPAWLPRRKPSMPAPEPQPYRAVAHTWKAPNVIPEDAQWRPSLPYEVGDKVELDGQEHTIGGVYRPDAPVPVADPHALYRTADDRGYVQPFYIVHQIGTAAVVDRCTLCAGMVLDRETHTDWHNSVRGIE